MSGQPARSVDEESRLLAATLRRSWPESRDGAERPAPGSRRDGGRDAAPVDADDHGAGSECASCPWCRSGEWRREQGADLLRSLADVASLAATGLRTLADSWQRPDDDEGDDDDDLAAWSARHHADASGGAGAASDDQAGPRGAGGDGPAPGRQKSFEQQDERQESA